MEMLEIIAPRKVRISREGIALFNAYGSRSTLRASRAYWFEFDVNQELIDSDVPQSDEGDAATALMLDAAAWLFDGIVPGWLP